jgi:hypothetical protein
MQKLKRFKKKVSDFKETMFGKLEKIKIRKLYE